MSEVINWITSKNHTYKYVISGASWYEDNLELWTNNDSLHMFQVSFADSWDTHFDLATGGLPLSGDHEVGHYVWFSHKGLNKSISDTDTVQEVLQPIDYVFFEESWAGNRNEELLNRMLKTLEAYWETEWECGYGHGTKEGMYEIKWCKTNGN